MQVRLPRALRGRRRRTVASAIAAAVLMTLLTMQPASAAQITMNYEWETSSVAVGKGCATNSSYLIGFVQAILWSHGYYANYGGNTTSQIDNAWGNNTYNALRAYQRAHSLDDDGCAGSRTYKTMQHFTHRIGTDTWSHLDGIKTCTALNNAPSPGTGSCWHWGPRNLKLYSDVDWGGWLWKHPRTGQWCRMSSQDIGGPECGAWVNF